MKKENIFGIVMYLLIFAFAVVYGLTVLQTHFEHSSMTQVWQYAIYIVLSIIVGIIISAILFEFGHFLGAKVGGYKIVKFTILYFSIYLADNGKYKFGFKNFNGMTGETIIVPNYEKKENPSPYPYLLYGPIFNLAWFVGALILFFAFNNGNPFDSDVAYAILTIGLISVVLFIYDFVPVKLDSSTDGYRFATLLKTKDIKQFNDLLTAQYEANYGKLEGADKVASNEKKKDVVPAAVTNTTEGKLIYLYTLIDEKRFDEASQTLDEIFANEKDLSKRGHLEALEQQIYVKIMTLPIEEMTKYYEEEVSLSLKREISSDYTIIGIRTYLLMAGLLDKSRSECLLVLKHIAKAYKNTPANRKHAELVIFNEALEKVCNAHPKWELEIYKLYE